MTSGRGRRRWVDRGVGGGRGVGEREREALVAAPQPTSNLFVRQNSFADFSVHFHRVQFETTRPPVVDAEPFIKPYNALKSNFSLGFYLFFFIIIIIIFVTVRVSRAASLSSVSARQYAFPAERLTCFFRFFKKRRVGCLPAQRERRKKIPP